ncbi:MAG: sensor histidine kinase [Flavobacterium sp.]|jgi:signal transduction histidine kinase|nr:sensor histidine kinase [Flavobacterium sp.]
MKKYYLCFLLTALCFTGFSQTKLDSLKKVLAKLPPEGRSFAGDTMRVRVLCEMGEGLPIGQEDSAIKVFNKALLVSDNLDWQFGQIISYFNIGYGYASKNEYIPAIDNLFKSLGIAESIKNYQYVAKNSKTLGDLYAVLGDYNKAENFLLKSIKYYKSNNEKSNYLFALNSLGLLYDNSKKYDEAINVFAKCLKINKVERLPKLNAHYLINSGYVFIHKKQYKLAKEYLEKALVELDSTNEYENFTKILNLVSLADACNYLNDSQKAIDYLNRATQLSEKYGNEVSGKFYYEVAYKVYKNIDPSKALSFYEKYVELKEMTSQQDYENKVKNLQATFDNAKSQREILLLNQNLRQGTIINYILFFGSVLLLIFAVWFWRTNKKLSQKNQTIETQQSEILAINRQLEALNTGLESRVQERTQQLQNANDELIKKNEEIILALVEGQTIERKRVAIELHDNLGSTLSSLKWRLEAISGQNLTEKEKKIYDGVVEMMKSAYSEVRLISHNMLPAELENKGLRGALEKLVNDINLSGKLDLKLEFDENLNINDKKITIELYSICLELVNNILKHSGATETLIRFYKKEDFITLTVEDNGKGFKNNESHGIGLKNLNDRIEAIKGKLYINSVLGVGTIITLSFTID